MRATAGLALAGMIMGWAAPTAADGDAKAGAAFARQHCAACHAIAGTGASPNPSAPPFRGITKDWPAETVAEALAEGIRIGHEGKPMINLELTIEEVADLVAYIASVQR